MRRLLWLPAPVSMLVRVVVCVTPRHNILVTRLLLLPSQAQALPLPPRQGGSLGGALSSLLGRVFSRQAGWQGRRPEAGALADAVVGAPLHADALAPVVPVLSLLIGCRCPVLLRPPLRKLPVRKVGGHAKAPRRRAAQCHVR